MTHCLPVLHKPKGKRLLIMFNHKGAIINKQQTYRDVCMNINSYWNKKSNRKKYENLRSFWNTPCQKEALSIIEPVKNNDTLIIGLGAGIEDRAFINTGCKVTAIDITHEGFSKYRSNDTSNYKEQTSKIVMDVHFLGFPSNTFDIVYVQHVMMHVNPDKVAQEVHRVLKPDGMFVVIEILSQNLSSIIIKRLAYSKKEHRDNINYLSLDSFNNIGKLFTKIIIEREYYLFAPLYYPLRLLADYQIKTTRLIEWLLYLESRLLNVFPVFRKNSMFGLAIYQK